MTALRITLGVLVLVTADIDLRPLSGLKRGERGIVTCWEPGRIFIKWLRPHWDWPGSWHNELMLTEDDDDKLGKLDFESTNLSHVA